MHGYGCGFRGRFRFVGMGMGMGIRVRVRWLEGFLDVCLPVILLPGSAICWLGRLIRRGGIRNTDDGDRCELLGGSRDRDLRERQELLLQILGGDLVQGTGGDFCSGDAQLLGLAENELALEVELLGDVVDANGHTGYLGGGGSEVGGRGMFSERKTSWSRRRRPDGGQVRHGPPRG